MASEKSFGLSRIGQIAINVQDLKRAISFYSDVLGMEFLFEAPPNMAFLMCGEVRLLLGIADKPEYDHPASIIYYKVDDIESAAKTLKERGVEFVQEPLVVHKTEASSLWLGFFQDTEGNNLALMCEQAHG